MMKKLIKIFVLGTLFMGFVMTVNAQSASMTASGELVAANTIAKTVDLNFGKMASGIAGVITVTGNVTATRTVSTGSVALRGGTVSSAKFTLTGDIGQVYTITLPSSITVTKVSSTETMTVDAFSCDVASAGLSVVGTAAHSTLGALSRDFYIGGSLNIGATNPIGVYTSAPFSITLALE